MATLQQHKEAMVDLLANGSAIPASAARLAHALHDVFGLLLERDSGPRGSRVSEHVCGTIEDVRFAADLDSAVSPRQRESLLIDNLRAELARVTDERDMLAAACESLRAELANVTSQRDTYKVRSEVLTAQVFDLDERIEKLEIKLQDCKTKKKS